MADTNNPFSESKGQSDPLLTSTARFSAHVELLQLFLLHRAQIVEKILAVLNAQKMPLHYQQDTGLLSRQLKECFFTLPGITPDQSALEGQLEAAHWACGFKPRTNPGNDLVNPTEMMIRGFHFWRETRWPGNNARERYAHTLFNLYLIRRLALLCMRLWDGAKETSGQRLVQLQQVLDQLWLSSPSDQPVLVRKIHWLLPLAMSPTTDTLDGYFDIAQLITEALPEADRLEVCKASVVTGSGHLRSQLRHLCRQNMVPVNDHALVLLTRKSNALDIALLLQGLVPLLAAYQHAHQQGAENQRKELAQAIVQGISPDPELFLNRLDLLGPYTMIEHLCVTTDSSGQAAYTRIGKRHLTLLQRYETLLRNLARPLFEDFLLGRSQPSAYSPMGVLYGFSSNLIELMAFKTLQREPLTQFTLEDIFTQGDVEKLAWVNGWRNLPHIHPEVVKQYEYPQQFTDEILTGIEQAFKQALTDSSTQTTAPCGRLYILNEGTLETDPTLAHIPALAIKYIQSSDEQQVAEHQAEALEESDLLHCRLEGEYVLSYQTDHGWLGISKDILTELAGAGVDAKVAGVPEDAAASLRLLCPAHVVLCQP